MDIGRHKIRGTEKESEREGERGRERERGGERWEKTGLKIQIYVQLECLTYEKKR